MRSLGNGEFEKAIAQALEKSGKLGYNVNRELLNAADFGVPQIRKRLIFVAVRKDIKAEFKFPTPIFGKNRKPYRTIKDAIGDLPYLANDESKDEYTTHPRTDYQLLMRNDTKILYNHKSPKHPKSTVEKINNTLPGQPMYENYKQRIRLSWDM